MTSTEASIALNMLPTVGPVRLRKLLEVFGTPQRVLTAKRSELRAVEGIGGEVARPIGAWGSNVRLPPELNRVLELRGAVIGKRFPYLPSLLPGHHTPPNFPFALGG